MINRGSITRKYIYIYKLETEESSFKNWRVSRRISILHWKFDSPGTSCALSKTRGAKWFHNFLIANLSHHAARSPHPSLENFLPDFSAREVSANVTFFPPSSFSYFINFQASKEKCWRNNKCVWTHRFDIEIRKKKRKIPTTWIHLIHVTIVFGEPQGSNSDSYVLLELKEDSVAIRDETLGNAQDKRRLGKFRNVDSRLTRSRSSFSNNELNISTIETLCSTCQFTIITH